MAVPKEISFKSPLGFCSTSCIIVVILVHFRALEKPKEDDFCLELAKTDTYDDVVERVAQRLDVDDPSKIRLTPHNYYSQQPKPNPIKYRSMVHLVDMLIHDNQDILYYEVLEIPLPELQCLKTLKVAFHHSKKDEVEILNVRLPKQSTVEDFLKGIKSKVELSHPNAELRLLEIFYHKIFKILPLTEKFENINDQYWTLRAEEIPEEEKNLGPHDRLIHVYHFTKKTPQMPMQNFGEPFFLVIHECETLVEIKVRVQKKLQVPDEEFSKWKLAYVSFGHPEYLQDTDIVSSRFQRRYVYDAWDQYLGLEHADNTSKRPYVSQEMEFRLSEINDIVYSKDNDSQRSENNVTTLLVPSCSSHRPGLFNNERIEQVNLLLPDLLLPHATEATVMNRGSMVNANVAHDRCNGGGEIVQSDLLCEKSNVEIDSSSNDKVDHNDIARVSSSCERLLVEADAMNNIQNIDSKNKCTIARLEKDYGITREILEQHFGKTLVDAAKTLRVSRSTLKRVCREYNISRWPHQKTRKVCHRVRQGVSLQSAEQYVEDAQQHPDLSQEKGTDLLAHKKSPAAEKPCDNPMTLKVTYRGDIIKFQLSPSSTRVELEVEVEKRFNISLQRCSIKYQDDDDDWILITSNSDLRAGMKSLRVFFLCQLYLLYVFELIINNREI